jgi:hypothetical protein
METISPASALLVLLKEGAKVELQDEYWIKGDPDTHYIDYGTQFGSEGLYPLNEEGVESVLKEIDKLRETRDEE